MTVESPGADRLADALRDADVFRQLPDEIRAALAAHMTRVLVADGEAVLEQGQPGHHLYVVLTGELDVSATSSKGAIRRMAALGPNRIVGEASLLRDAPAPVTARARGAVTLAALPREHFARFGDENPPAMFVVMEELRPALHRHRLRVALQTSDMFGELDAAAFEDLESSLEFKALYGGEILMREGDTSDEMYIVLSGRLRVVAGADGAERTIAELGAGDPVGEMALVSGDPRTATVYAVRDTQLARLTKPAFQRLLDRHPRMAFGMISTRLVARLKVETRRVRHDHSVTTVAVVPATPGIALRPFCQRLAAGLSRLGATMQLSSDVVDGHLGASGIAQSFDREHHGARLVEWLAEEELDHRFVVYESDAGLSPWTERSIRQADQIIVVGDATADPRLGEIEDGLLSGSRRHLPRQTLALVHPPGHSAPTGSLRWLAPRQVTRHVHVRSDSQADFDRLARMVTGNAVGLALGGGFARGLAHLGVFRALAELGIPVDVVGGSSMGAMVGAQWALGWSADEIARRTSEGLAASFDDMTLPFLSFKRGGKHSRLIHGFFGDTQIEDLWFPYFCVSTNLNRSALRIHQSGSLSEAVTASTRAPGIFPPLVIDGELHVDGGVINNVPVDVMSEVATGSLVIGVDVSPPHELNEVANYGHDVSGWQAVWNRFNPNRQKRIYRPSILLVLMRVIEFGGISYRREKADMADIYISPDVLRFKRNDFHAWTQLGDAGYTAAHAVLTRWLADEGNDFRARRPDLFRRQPPRQQAAEEPSPR